MRVLPLLLCLLLAACVTDGGEPAATGSNAQAAAAAAPDAQPAAKPSSKRAAKRKEKEKEKEEAANPDAPTAASDDDGPMTREKASAKCWMKYEQGRRDLPLDKRADLVNKCVADTLKANPVR